MSYALARNKVQEEFQFLGVDLSKIGESDDPDAAPTVEKMSNTQMKKEVRRRIKMKIGTLKEFFGPITHLIELWVAGPPPPMACLVPPRRQARGAIGGV